MINYYKVLGNSMFPAVKDGGYVLSEKLSYYFFQPRIGDIIILKSPDNINLIKRIIKKEGENYFVEGDNKEQSLDSRNFGPIKNNRILAKVIYK